MGTIADAMSIPQLIEGLARRYGSINAAARALGMPEGTLQALHQGRRQSPRLDTLRILARGLDIPLHELIKELESDSAQV